MKTKFAPGEHAAFEGKEVVIKLAKKDFRTKNISYRLEDERIVEEHKLKKLESLSEDKDEKDELKELHEQYEELFKKPVPTNKKNKPDWIKKKIDEEKQKSDPWKLLVALDEKHLKSFIKEKKLDISPEDYGDINELKIAVAQELEIEIPE